jgi:hypothetical protein
LLISGATACFDAAARRAGILADTIIEVGSEIVPSGATNPFSMERYAEK